MTETTTERARRAKRTLIDVVPLSISSTWDETELRNIVRAMIEFGEGGEPEPKAGGNFVLPCDVKLPPATTIKAGCTLETLMVALTREGRPRHFQPRSISEQAQQTATRLAARMGAVYVPDHRTDISAVPSDITPPQQPSAADMAAFGASEAAGYFYPNEDQAKERAAFCAGVAHTVQQQPAEPVEAGEWPIGARVEKVGGASWSGLIVGTYRTKLTPEGYAVESENEPGSVQIYPRKALRLLAAAPSVPQDERELWKHVKRGTVYEVIARGELQVGSDLVDGSAMVIYRGDDGRFWVREESEFEDGRFVRVAPRP